jgi:hypothetical protein
MPIVGQEVRKESRTSTEPVPSSITSSPVSTVSAAAASDAPVASVSAADSSFPIHVPFVSVPSSHDSTFDSSFDSISSSSSSTSTSIPSHSTAVHPEAATVHQCTPFWLRAISEMRSCHACASDPDTLDEIERHIRNGIDVSLDLLSPPQPIHFANTTTVDENFDEVQARIAEYISIGAVRVVQLSESASNSSSSAAPSMVQPLHVIMKPNKKPRLVIDLSRNLNDLIPHREFHYTSIQDAVKLSYPGCWYSKLDISNCFLSFPLHENSLQYFVFLFDGVYYQFVRLPFGLTSAPRICTILLSVVQFVLERHHGLTLVRYLDDFLLISMSAELASQHLSTAIRVLQQFGLVVNASKTEGPATCIQFLGVNINSVTLTLSISAERIAQMNELLMLHISTPSSTAVRVVDILSFIGKLNFVSQILVSARPFMRRLLNAVTGKRHRARCRIPPEFRLDCAVWLQRMEQWNGRISWSIHTQKPFVIISDASISGFGFYLHSFPSNTPLDRVPAALRPGSAISGTWHSSMSHLLSHRSIAHLELFSVLFALTLLSPALHHQSVLILTDNSSNVPVINKQRTSSPAIIGLLRALAELSSTHVFACSARHISGESNVLADFLSRPALHMNQHVSQWRSYEFSHSFPLSRVALVCSSSLLLPDPTPLHFQPAHARNVTLNYLPSLTCSPRWHCEPTPNVPTSPISEPSFDSAASSDSIH